MYFKSSGQLPGQDVQENRWWDIVDWWVAPSLSSSPPGLCQWVGVSLTGQPKGSHFSWTPLFRFPIKTDWFCLSPAGNYEIMMKLNHWGFPLLRADSSAGCGSRECLTKLMGSCYICCTPGLACSAPSTGGEQLSLHSGSLSHTRGSGSSHWCGKGHLGSCMPTNLITFRDSDRGTAWRNLRPFGKDLRA